jgi:hypothetical protein
LNMRTRIPILFALSILLTNGSQFAGADPTIISAPVKSPISPSGSSPSTVSVSHSVNRYAHGNQTLSGSRLQHTPVVPQRPPATVRKTSTTGHHSVEHLVLIGKDAKATGVARGGRSSVHSMHLVHGKRGNGEGSGSEGGGSGSFAGANGDGGGGGESIGALSTSSVNIPMATAQQARAFWTAVHGDFKRWDTSHDGRLTRSEMSRGLRNPSIKGNKAAALSALLVTMKESPATSTTSVHVPKYWSLDGLQKIVSAAEQTNHSRLINRFVQHTQALQDKQPEKLPLFGRADQSLLADLHRGPADNHAFMAAAAGLAYSRPEALRSMINADSKGNFRVRFPNTAEIPIHLTEGDIAEFASTGRSVLWLDVLRKAHEELAEESVEKPGQGASASKASSTPLIDLLDDADASQVVPLLTHHEVESLDLSNEKPEQLRNSISAAVEQKRLVLLENQKETQVVLAVDPAKNTVSLWSPGTEPNQAASVGNDKTQQALAAGTRIVQFDQLSKDFSKAFIETNKNTSRDYSEILRTKTGENSLTSVAFENAEDAYLTELQSSGITIKTDSSGKEVIVMDEDARASRVSADSHGQKIVELELTQGSALIAHENHVRVKTALCDVHVSPNAAAYVISLAGSTAVFNLSDMRSGEVLVKVGLSMKEIRVPLGQQIVLTKNLKDDFEAANPDNLIAHRKSVSLGVIDGVDVFRAEFSFTSLLDNAEGFSDLCSSSIPSDKKIVSRLIKTAAIMLTLRPAFDESTPAANEASEKSAAIKDDQPAKDANAVKQTKDANGSKDTAGAAKAESGD